MTSKTTRTGPMTLALLWGLGPLTAMAESTATSNQLLKLNQWDWKQAIAAPRQGFLQRDAVQTMKQRPSEQIPTRTRTPNPPDPQSTIDREIAKERLDEQQLYEKQRRERVATSRNTTAGTPVERQARQQQQQQTQRFKAESDNLRLQQDIQRRAVNRP